MTLFEKLKSLEGKQVTLISHFMGREFYTSGKLEVHKPVYPNQAALTFEGAIGAYNANSSTVIHESDKTITISVRS